MEQKIINIVEARAMLEELKSLKWDHVFRVSFFKKDGSHREMLARFGVKKNLKGGELAYSPKEKDLIVVADMGVLKEKAAKLSDLEAKLAIEADAAALAALKKEQAKWEKEAGYRMIPFNRLVSLTVDGITYLIDQPLAGVVR